MNNAGIYSFLNIHMYTSVIISSACIFRNRVGMSKIINILKLFGPDFQACLPIPLPTPAIIFQNICLAVLIFFIIM